MSRTRWASPMREEAWSRMIQDQCCTGSIFLMGSGSLMTKTEMFRFHTSRVPRKISGRVRIPGLRFRFLQQFFKPLYSTRNSPGHVRGTKAVSKWHDAVDTMEILCEKFTNTLKIFSGDVCVCSACNFYHFS